MSILRKHSRWMLVCVPGLFLLSCKESVITPLSHLPTASLSATSYPAGQTGINQSGQATIQAHFQNATETDLVDATNTTASPPTGIHATISGNPLCDLELSNSSTTGAELKLSNCTGDGEVRISFEAGVLTNEHSKSNKASNTVAVRIDNQAPSVLSFSTAAAAVDSSTGGNTATLTFSERVVAPSTDNSGSEFTISGCATSPTIATSSSVNGAGRTVTAVTLSGGSCDDGDIVALGFDISKVTDLAGNTAASSTHNANYSITSAAITNLATPSYPGSTSALHAGSSALNLAVTFSNVSSTTLATTTTGTTASAPTGVEIANVLGVTCDVNVTSTSLSNTFVKTENCTGDGSFEMRVEAGTALSTGGLSNSASAWKTVFVENSTPTVYNWALDQVTSIDGDGTNSLVITFDRMVQPLSAANADQVITLVTGCTTPPTVAITMGDNGAGQSTATVQLTNGVCTSGDSIEVILDLEKVLNLSGLQGLSADNPTSLTYTVP